MKKAKAAPATEVIEITSAMLPLYCPRPNMPLWSQHPRVYLPIDETGHEQCPYCGNKYVLNEVK